MTHQRPLFTGISLMVASIAILPSCKEEVGHRAAYIDADSSTEADQRETDSDSNPGVDTTGHDGGPCFENGTCLPGNRCDQDLFLCVPCELGSLGCQCTGSGGCSQGLACAGGACVPAGEKPPENPRCFTPCINDLVTEDEERFCDSDRLLAGCIGGLECHRGSCVEPGADKAKCESDLDCPFFQTCLMGGCYSNCAVHADCESGLGCYKKSCRRPCEVATGASVCPNGYHCDSSNGESGYCMPMGNDILEFSPPPSHGFTLTTGLVALSNVKTFDTFGIVPDTEHSAVFTIRKLRHTLYRADGTSETVDAPRDLETGEYTECNAAMGECPLFWLDLSDGKNTTKDQTLATEALPLCGTKCPVITVAGAGNAPGVRWEGELEITGKSSRATVLLTYVERPEGQWVGTMYYFGNFNDKGLDAWMAQANRGDVTKVDNALIKRWGAFRSGSLGGGWDEMLAVLTATRTESWKYAAVGNRCKIVNSGSTKAACYPYSNAAGVRTYVTDLFAAEIPTGVTEFPIAMNLRMPESGQMNRLIGRIDTALTLHYPGNPAVELELSHDPAASNACDPSVSTDCVVFLDELEAQAIVGGRYLSSKSDDCGTGYTKAQLPWLVPGFEGHAHADPNTGRMYTYFCLDNELPFDATGNSSLASSNMALAGGNPVPDGVPRPRTLRLVDGALINQRELFILFEEVFESFFENGAKEIPAYGYMVLRRQPTDLAVDDDNKNGIPDAFEGNSPPASTAKTLSSHLGVTCEQALLDDMALDMEGQSLKDLFLDGLGADVLDTLLMGNQVDGSSEKLPSDRTSSDVRVHYLCEDTGLFNGGGNDRGGASDNRIPCPAGSKVTFFAVKSASTLSRAAIADDSCQASVVCDDAGCRGGTCQQRLNQWRVNRLIEEWSPFWRCEDTNKIFCDDHRLDLRQGKEFYAPPAGPTSRVFLSLDPVIFDAFRYKTRFVSDTGTQVGFAPQICIPNSDQRPYCYDPAMIEEARQRVDCLLAISSDSALYSALDEPRKIDLNAFLRKSFRRDYDKGHDGFERLYSELLIMLGDESLTAAFASRFDLAGAGGAAFEGTYFENNGIDLSGVAGFEMFSLYQAVQYYQMSLDRMYFAGPNFEKALLKGSTDSELNFISPDTVVSYFDRLIRASTQKGRAMSEIAKKYQSFNRPDLARAVVERAYVSTFLESAIISRLMWSIADSSQLSNRPQIEKTIVDAHRRYKMALLDMRDLFSSITDTINYFGFAPDYIPFPALDSTLATTSGFEVMMNTTQSKVSLAGQREKQALDSHIGWRGTIPMTAQFQADLVRLRNNYENQLAGICGTFEGEDEKIHPAIAKYADRTRYASLLGDPCGRMGNGGIYSAMADYEQSLLAQQILQTRFYNVLAEVDIEEARVASQCDLIDEIAEFEYEAAGEKRTLRSEIAVVRTTVEAANRKIQAASNVIQATMCVPSSPIDLSCISKVGQAQAQAITDIGKSFNTVIMETKIKNLERQIADIERHTARWVTQKKCDAALIDSNASTAKLLLNLKVIQLEMLRAERSSNLELSDIIRLQNDAQRGQAEQTEAEQMLINVEAARSDPNVRIYRNDAIINADISFNDAMRSAYRLTKLYEYYTSQSYARLDQLFLIRMVTAGDYNLQNFLVELQNAYYEFEETYGLPNTRVVVLSMRDDVMRIPTLDDNGAALSQSARIELMRQKLGSVDLLDSRGYLTLPFATSLEYLSPLTRNHKVLYMEADIVGSDVGDTVGRLYLRQAGTGVVRNIAGDKDYYIFPERTAVLNPFFNGNKVFAAEVYRNQRLRDRPLVNTAWELTINQRDEMANRDINLKSISDIRLIVYYSDFTAL